MTKQPGPPPLCIPDYERGWDDGFNSGMGVMLVLVGVVLCGGAAPFWLIVEVW